MPVQNSDNYLNSRRLQRWWLAFAFVLSFFALSGYIINLQQTTPPAPTEAILLTGRCKRIVSYKTACYFFYNKITTDSFFTKNNKVVCLLYNRAVKTKYLNLRRVALFIPLSVPRQIISFADAESVPPITQS